MRCAGLMYMHYELFEYCFQAITSLTNSLPQQQHEPHQDQEQEQIVTKATSANQVVFLPFPFYLRQATLLGNLLNLSNPLDN